MIHHGDCLQVMKQIPDASVDACITDPPYGTTACSWDAVIPFAPMWVELKRIVKKNGAIVLFGSQPFTSALVMSNPLMFKYEIVAERSIASNHLNHDIQPLRYHENVLVFYRDQCVFNKQPAERKDSAKSRIKSGINSSFSTNRIYGLMADVGRRFYDTETINPKSVVYFDSVPNCNGIRNHPSEKPVELLRYLVRTYTNEGDTVLDFTCGSGTTGVACAIERREFIGIEKDAHYFQVAEARIKRAQGIACDIPKRVKQYAPTPLFEAVA